MTGYVILGIVGLILAFILLVPVQVRVSYELGEVRASVRAAAFTVALYPRAEKKKEDEKKPKEKEETSAGTEKKKKKFSLNAGQILYTLEKLPPILGRALKGLIRRLRIDPLKVHLLVAGSDPADTAVLYGRLTAALEAALPVLHRVLDIREQDIRLFPDFQQEKMDVIADVGVSIRLWDVLVIALRAGASLLGWFLGFRKLADKAETAQNETENTASGADAA